MLLQRPATISHPPTRIGISLETPAEILDTVAQELHVSETVLLKLALRTLLKRQLREIKAQIFEITGRYGISSVEEMEACYREGTLEEAESWRDLQRLDHLEYKRDRLLQLLTDPARQRTPQTVAVRGDFSPPFLQRQRNDCRGKSYQRRSRRGTARVLGLCTRQDR